MSQNFQPIQLLQDKADAYETGHLQILANSVTWKLYLVEGKLQYAYHSLQSLDTIKHYLLRLNPNAVAKIKSISAQNLSNNHQLMSFVNQLVDQNGFNSDQKAILSQELTKDALESSFWLTEGQYRWKPTNPLESINIAGTSEDNFLEIPPLITSLQTKLQAWQQLNPLIISPHQRLSCLNPSLLQQKVASGNLPPEILTKLVKLMGDATIRQIGLFLKQDDLKMAQLLFPYIKAKIIHLLSPKFPLDKLPKIPSSPTKYQPSKSKSNSAPFSQSIAQSQTQKRFYKIACIDDSPTMLDLIKDYLETEKYEIFAIKNPLESLSLLFKTKPDLILMDFSMPGINGNRLCEILKRSPAFKNTPIVMVSGNSKMLNPEKMQASGVQDFLPKPFTQKSLLAIVEKHLRPC